MQAALGRRFRSYWEPVEMRELNVYGPGGLSSPLSFEGAVEPLGRVRIWLVLGPSVPAFRPSLLACGT